MPFLRFFAYDQDDIKGAALSEVTDATQKAILREYGGLGSGEFNLWRFSDQRNDCQAGRYIRVWLTDTIDEVVAGDPIAGFFVAESRDTILSPDEQGAEVFHRSGPGPMSVLADAIAWFESSTSNTTAVPGEDGAWHWGGVNAGGVMVRMLEEAIARGCWADGVGTFLTYDFSRTLDSNGDPWVTTVEDFHLDIGTDLLTLAGKLQDMGLIFVMDPDFTLHAYEASSYGTDRSATVTFEHAVNISTGAERTVYATPVRSTVLVRGTRGDNGAPAYIDASSAAGLDAAKRRREGYMDVGETTGYQTLVNIGLESIYRDLRLVSGPAGFGVYDTSLDPFTDYDVGDTVTVTVAYAWETVEKQITSIVIEDTEAGDVNVFVGFDVLAQLGTIGSPGGGGGTVVNPVPIDRAALGEAWMLESTSVLTEFNQTYGTVSSGHSGSYGAAPANPTYTNDDNHGSDSVRASFAMAAGTVTWWWQTDLAATRNVDSMEVYENAGVYAWDYNPPVIAGSADGSSWTTISWTSAPGTYESNAPGGGTRAKTVYTFDATESYRYFRMTKSVTVGGLTFISHDAMCEWKIYGDESGAGSTWTNDAPLAIDGNDTTYEGAITGTDVLRVNLGASYRIVRSRLRIACQNSGSRTYTIKGANIADFSDEVTLATFTFTATGSYTAQDVTTLWVNTTPYRWYELSGTSESRRIHTWELYEATADGTTATVGSGIVTDPTTGNGATLQDVLDHLNVGWFNVTNYGATGDGTTDDTSALNSAIAALNAAGGGVLYFPHPADAYKITAALTTITAPCVIRGDGAAAFPYATGTGSRIEQTSDTASVFTFTDPGWVIEDIAIINTEGTPTAGSAIVASSTAPLYARMSRIEVGGFYDCIDLNGNGRWTLTDSYVYDPVRYGIRIRGADDGDMAIAGCYFMSDTHDADAAIRQEGGGGLKVTNTKVNIRGVSGGEFVDGINATFGAGVQTSVLLVSNSSFENMTRHGIYLQTTGSGFFGMSSFDGLQFSLPGNTGRAIKIEAATNGSLTTAGSIAGVVIDGIVARTVGTARAAVELINTDRVTLGDIQLVDNFTSRYTSSGDTNTTDGVALSYAGTGDIADVAATEGAGAATSVARGDHVHALGITTTRGDLIRRGATANERVALGTSGYVLTSDGTDAVWAAPSGGGGHYEVIVSGSAPPVAVTNETEDDWLYGWVPD